MDLIMLVLVCVLLGFLVWLLTTKVPMPEFWASTIQLGVLIAMILWILSRFVALPNVLPR